jgi:WD40 repeat protein
MRMPGGVSGVLSSHDGQFIYTAGSDPHIWIWDGNTYELRDRIKTKLKYLCSPVLHPTHEQVAAGGPDGTVRLWDIKARTEMVCAQRHAQPVTAVCFVEEGRLLASGSADGTVRLTETKSGKRVGRLKRLGSKVLRLSAPTAGRTVGAVHERGVRIWDADLTDRFSVAGLYYHGGELQSDLAFCNNGESVWVTFWGREPYLRIWSLAGLSPERLPAALLSSGAHEIALSPDERLAALALYHEIVLIDTQTQAIVAQWPVPCGPERYQGPPRGLAFFPDRQRLISADIAGGIWVWPVPLAKTDRGGVKMRATRAGRT